MFPPIGRIAFERKQRQQSPQDHLHDFAPESFESRAEATMVTASQTLGATPAAEYSWRAPSPPHIHIPPTSEDNLFLLPEFSGSAGEEHNEILKIVTEHRPILKSSGDWKYVMRRQAQQIISFLYLGPSSAARNIVALQQEGISMLLVIRNAQSAQYKLLSGEKVATQIGIEHDTVDVSGNQQLISFGFHQAITKINNHLISEFRRRYPNGVDPNSNTTKWPKVLVFCESGNERSAGVVVAYVMAMYSLNLVEAIQYVQSKRFCVAFDDDMKRLLLSWHDCLQAKRIVQNHQSHIPTTKAAIKRGRDEMDDDAMEIDLDQPDDQSRFGSRSTFAPFYDGYQCV